MTSLISVSFLRASIVAHKLRSGYYLAVLTGTISSFCQEIATGKHAKPIARRRTKKRILLMYSDTENKYKDVTNGGMLPAIAFDSYCTCGYNLEEV